MLFDDIFIIKDFDISNNLLDEKSSENILLYDISHKNLINTKPLCIRLDKLNGFFNSRKKHWLSIRLSYLLSKFFKKIKIFTSIIS